MSATLLHPTRAEMIAWAVPPSEIKYGLYLCTCGREYENIIHDDTSGMMCPSCSLKATREEELRAVADRFARETASSVPPRYQWAAFGAPELAKRVRPTRAIETAQVSLEAPAIVLLGPAGSGKTSLACAILRAMAAHRRTWGLFTSSFALAKARREQRLGRGEAEPIDSACRTSVLLLDELAAEQDRDTSVDEVIRCRHDYELPTVYTSGFGAERIIARYGDGVGRRIFEQAIVIELGGGN